MPTQSTKEFVAGESFMLLGQQRRLKFSRQVGPSAAMATGLSLVVLAAPRRAPTKEETRKALSLCFRNEAAVVFRQRLIRLFPKLGLKEIPRLLIANQTRRWGSCNSRNELRINWRLVGAPLSIIDYVIVHELCHLRWQDHSASFWRELRRIMPDYQIREQALASLGPSLLF